jgi:hypothetical protein
MKSLYTLITEAKARNSEALENILKIYEPKLKHCLQSVPAAERSDVEQELKIKLIEMVFHYDLQAVPGFWEYSVACNSIK